MSTYSTPYREVEEFGDQILSRAVKAGHRTYFFDVRATRGNDYFLTITESRKKTNDDGSTGFERHKIFLYKEDFAKFSRGLSDAIEFIKRKKPEFFECHKLSQNTAEGKSIDKESEKKYFVAESQCNAAQEK